MEERGLSGLEARAGDGSVLGTISDIITDEESGEVTHVVVETGEGERRQLPITDVVLDPGADFARFDADPSDAQPGDHVGDEAGGSPVPDAASTSEEVPQGYAPAQSDVEDREHEGQFVSTPQDTGEAISPAENEAAEAAEASGWEDEGSTTADSGYPRNDAYINPETGEEEVDPLLRESDTLGDDVGNLLANTDVEVRAVRDGVVELTGSAATREDLDALVDEIMGLDGVREVDTTDVDVG